MRAAYNEKQGLAHEVIQVDAVLAAGAHHAVVLGDGAADRINAIAPGGVDRVAEIDLAGGAGLDVGR